MRARIICAALICIFSAQAQVPEKEAAIGAQLALRFQSSAKPLDAVVGAGRYVQNLGQRLASHVPNGGGKWTFQVIQDYKPACELTAFPGGYIFIPACALLRADNEAELAGLLAHSMAHIVLARQAAEASTSNATVPLFFFGCANNPGDFECLDLPVASKPKRLQQELESDSKALQIMAAAGYDPDALLAYIQRAEPESEWKTARTINLAANAIQ